MRVLIKKCGCTGRASAGVQGTGVWAWVSGAPVPIAAQLPYQSMGTYENSGIREAAAQLPL